MGWTRYSGKEIITQQPFPAPTWLLEGLIPGGGWTLLLGAGKVGKSLFAVQLAYALATGREFFGASNRVQHPLRVAFVQNDTPRDVWQAQLTQLGLNDDPTTYLFPDGWGSLTTGGSLARQELSTVKPDFVIWDSMEKLFFGLDLSQKEVMAQCVARLTALSGAAFALIHHTRKGVPGEEDNARNAAWGSSFLSHDWTQQLYFRGPQGPVEITGRLIEDVLLRPGKEVSRGAGGRWIRVPPRTYALEDDTESSSSLRRISAFPS